MIRTVKIVFWGFIAISAMLLWQVVRTTPENQKFPEITYSRFMSEVDSGNVASVEVTGTRIRGVYRDGKGSFHLTGPANAALFVDALRKRSVEIRFRDNGESLVLSLLGTWAPLILVAAMWYFMIRQMRPSGAISPSPSQGFGQPTGPR
jgi:cell division protease FtsH